MSTKNGSTSVPFLLTNVLDLPPRASPPDVRMLNHLIEYCIKDIELWGDEPYLSSYQRGQLMALIYVRFDVEWGEASHVASDIHRAIREGGK